MALKYGLPVGWSYEGPDESVGIFGEEWGHEDCVAPTGGIGNGEIQGVEHTERWIAEPDHNDMVDVVHLLVCKDCGEKVEFESVDYAGPCDCEKHVTV